MWGLRFLALALLPVLAWALNAGHMDSGYYQSRVFFIPAAQLSALLAALGAASLLARGLEPAHRLLPLGATAFMILTLAFRFQPMDRSRDLLSYDYGRQLMASLPRGAGIVTEGDNSLYPLFYFILGQGQRPDVVLLHKGALAAPWYQESLRQRHPGLVLNPAMNLNQVLLANADSFPLFFTEPRDELPPGFQYWPEAGLYRAVRRGESVALPLRPPAALRGSSDPRPWDWREQSILALNRLWTLRAAEALAGAGRALDSARLAMAGIAAFPPQEINYDRWVRQGLHRGLSAFYASQGRLSESAEESRRAEEIHLNPAGP
jgi:hypothetical protein